MSTIKKEMNLVRLLLVIFIGVFLRVLVRGARIFGSGIRHPSDVAYFRIFGIRWPSPDVANGCGGDITILN